MSHLPIRFKRLVLVVLLVTLVGGCATSPPRRRAAPKSIPRAAGPAVAQASYYASKFHGRPTASGERFDNGKLTAAHRTLSFGTKVRVTNLDNGRSVIVRVNDRGPFVRGRIIDLSQAAARRIDMVRAGVVPVRVQPVGARAERVVTRAD